ncbi:MAG TPA: ChbG/HpnK family deacetylase [Myxococcaceae bacterium]|nr:ChbG/HpnK family deacetylase [Myxococcaceae bacterium]
MAESLLIINADDLGYDPGVTRGILKAMFEGVVSSATFMVNTPFSAHAAEAATGLALGLHLNLARHLPVSRAFPAEHLHHGELHEPFADRLPPEAVEKETLAQLDRMEKLCGRTATHVDVHKHLHRHPNVLKGLLAAAKQRGVPVRAIDAGMRAAIRESGVKTTDHFIGDAGREPYWTLERFREHIERLTPGTTELMCHPGYVPEAVKSGYATQREVELQTFLHPGTRRILERCGVRVATFADLQA